MIARRPLVGRSRSISPRRRAAVYSAVASMLVWASFMAGPALAAEERPDYGIRAAREADTDRPGTSVIHALEAGTGVTDQVEIFNFTDQPMVFDLYAVDMVPSTGGGLTAAPRTAEPTGTGTWITPESAVVEVPPRSSRIIGFIAEVPQGITPGRHLGALMVEPQTTPSGGMIETRTRIGLSIELDVLGSVDLGLLLGDLTSTRTGTGIRLTLPVTNDGNVTLSTTASLVIRDRRGDVLATAPMDPPGVLLAPGDEITLTGTWGNPPLFGRYEATATVEAVVGDRPPVAFASEPLILWIVPWIQILTAVAIAAAIGWLLQRTAPRRRRWAARHRQERELVRAFRERLRREEVSHRRGRPRHTSAR